MRICQFISSVRPEVGGPARAVVDLSRALASRGHDVVLATCDPQGAPEEWRRGEPGLPHHIPLPRPARRPFAFSRSQIRQDVAPALEGCDVVHTHGVWEPLNLQVASLARRAEVPYFISVRGMLDDWCMAQRAIKKKVFLALGGRRWLEGARAVHLTARSELEQAQKHFPRGRGVVIPNLLDLEPFRALDAGALARSTYPELREGRSSVLFLSRLHPKKRLESLLESVTILKDRGLGLTLFIAGVGDEAYVQRVKSRARSLGLDGSEAVFTGQVTGPLKLSLYEACDLFALPTSQENFGFVFPESLACGTPVLTTKGVDIWGELESGGGAVIADEAPEPFADAMEHLLRDPERIRAMGDAGREWVFDWLDPDRLLDQFEAMYRGDLAEDVS